ncbi:hypothetical protein M758_3G169800 [Ceratodon purpureus]|uniref:Uncharacterized protein n=1 Tax=Ceratodon purpureus TaxID=3225 RepID=A0A8T0ILV5_CERPU|nr:hypothetical protein KC19_3G169900 [Ceratodon purpureus]KAG0623372.1 hypothetical protein M758_3G169500 [Ceratodon purpureus]KAG0623375.1 hypothetical protein M758_3G169800 [Ceratodon purpureus]
MIMFLCGTSVLCYPAVTGVFCNCEPGYDFFQDVTFLSESMLASSAARRFNITLEKLYDMHILNLCNFAL